MIFGFLAVAFAVTYVCIRAVTPEDKWFTTFFLVLALWGIALFTYALVVLPFFGVPVQKIFFPY
jgi:hypothetical protein